MAARSIPRTPALGLILILALPVSSALGDDFDRIDAEALARVPRQAGVEPRGRMTLAEIGGLPNVVKGARAPLLVVQTDAGNLARMLVTSAFRKAPGTRGEGVPVVVLDGFATFEAGGTRARLTRGQEVVLFDGFRFDLDAGQVVPEGQGGDVQFLAGGEGGPRIEAIGGAKLLAPTESPAPPEPKGIGVSSGRSVVPGDFAGRFRLFANGQWSGTLDLTVDDRGKVSGTFTSDLNGSRYPVSGQAGGEVPQRIAFSVEFPRSRQDFEGLLWTDGKGAMAGTVTFLDRPFGFFAIREGGRFAPEGAADLRPAPADDGRR